MSDAGPGLPEGPLDLLAKAALAPPEIAIAAWRDWRRDFSLDETPWNEVRMLASIAPRLKWLERDAGIAPRILGIRKFLYAQTQMCLMGAMEGMRILSAAGIPIMLMKGAARIARDPVAAQERLVRDVDVLVPFEDKTKAFDLLHAAGWGFKPSAKWQDFWRDIDETSHHAWSFAKGNAEIDLHHHSNHLNRLIDDDAGLWRRAEPMEWREIRLFVPSTTDNLLMSVVHGLRWSRDHAADWTVDACASIDTEHVDWPLFVAEIKARKLEAVAGSGLRYLRETLKKPIPADVMAALEAGITPQQLAEFAHYIAAPMARDLSEAAATFDMNMERLSQSREDNLAALHDSSLRVELSAAPNAPMKIDVASLGDAVGNLRVVVRLKTGLPSGTKLIGSLSLMGLLLDHAFTETGLGGHDDDECELTFSVFLPLVRQHGAKTLLFVAGIAGAATPLYWHREFTA